MKNLDLYYRYVIQPQILIKFPKLKNCLELKNFGIKKIRLNIFLLDKKNNYFIYLYNICILIRLIFNKFLFIKKVNKGYTISKMHFQLSLENTHIMLFMDVFGSFLLPLFESFNMGLRDQKFDIFGNYTFEFNYSDPVFMSKNTVIV